MGKSKKETQIPIDEIADRLATITTEELNRLPYGTIQLDDDGTIIFFSAVEESASGLSSAEVVGRNFFTDVAPCTNVRDFKEPFERAVASGNLNVRFDFLFKLPGNLRRATI